MSSKNSDKKSYMKFEIWAGTMNRAVSLPAKDDVSTENLMLKKKNCKNLLYEMVERSNWNSFIIGQIATHYFGEIPEEQK